MRKVLKISIVLMMLVGLIGTAHASTTILYFNDGFYGTDRMAEALGSLPGSDYSVTIVYDQKDFADAIAVPGTYNLGILMVQVHGSNLDAIQALGDFVAAAGGRSIYTDWNRDTTKATVFGAAWTTHTNETSFNVNVTGPLAAGITNPVELYDPGYAYPGNLTSTFSMGVGVLEGADGLVAATFPNNDGAIVIGNDGRSITNGFMTDTFAGDGSKGVQLYINEIKYLTDPVPLPGAVWLLGSGLLGLGLFRGRMRKN